MTASSKVRNIALSQLVLSSTNVRKTPTTAALSRQLRLLAQEVRAAATHLGLPIYQRTRISLPPPLPDEPVSAFRRFDTILPDGRRVPYAGPSPNVGKRKTRMPS